MNSDNRKVIELDLDDILPNRFQPRIKFSEDAINELSESIKEHGIIQPIVVRKINEKYEIIAGERRYKASVLAGKKTIPAIVTDLNDKESAEIALIENVQREDLTPIEEAVSYKKILNMGYLTQDDLSNKLGKKQSTISNKLRLLNLDEEVQEALLEKKISERHARSLLRLNTNDQKIMLNKITTERLTVRKADLEIEKLLGNNKVPDIEVLDLEDFPKVKGEIKMNNETNNNFNIPVSPIIEDIPVKEMIVEQVGPSFSEVSVPEPLSISSNNNIPEIVNSEPISQSIDLPGFMDVDKIQNEAADINIDKPMANLNNLLEPTPAPEEPKPVSVDASIFGFTPTEVSSTIEETPITTPGKFFDLDSLGEIEEASTPESIEKMLNSVAMPSEIKEENPLPIVEEIPDNKSQMFGINLKPKNPEFVENVELKVVNTDFEEPKPVIDSNDFNFNQFYNTTDPSEELPVSTISPIVVEEAISVPTPLEQPTIDIKTEMESIPTTMASVPPLVQTEPSVIASPATPINPPTYAIPSADELDNFLNDLDSKTPLSQATLEPISTPAASVTAPTNDVAKKMNQVVEIVREAKEKINSLGINVDLDEFDFDDMYQAIIKIDK